MARLNVWICSVAILAVGAGAAVGQEYPAKPIRLVSSAPGGSADFVTRVLARGLSDNFGQPVVVDNRGGNVAIPADIVSKAAPDGYTLLSIASPFWVAPLLQKGIRYHPVKDFSPVTLATTSPSMLVVGASLPANSVKDLIALARSRPGAINYGSGPTGGTSHIAPELFKKMAGVDIVRVPYRGTSAALGGLLSNQVQMMFGSPELLMPHVKARRLKALGVTSVKPYAQFPDVPTIADAGLPGYHAVGMVAVFGPAGIPGRLLERINREYARVLGNPRIRERLLRSGAEPVGSRPRELTETIQSEMARLGELIRDAGIRDN